MFHVSSFEREIPSGGSQAGNVSQASCPRQAASPPAIAHAESTVTAATRNSRNSGAAELKSEIAYPTYDGGMAIFDNYEFLGDVGSGSFGKVMVVQHKESRHYRACKAL